MKFNQLILEKIWKTEVLEEKLNELRAKKTNKIVFTNGCFDILHLGHVDYLMKSADLGTDLIVGINTDVSVKSLGKGESRPIQNEISRATIIASLQFVRAVVLFHENTPYELIKKIQPDVLVKGADYTPQDIVGYDIVMAKGGKVSTIEFLPGYSTSLIEQKIKKF